LIRGSRELFDELPVERACALLSVSRTQYYRDGPVGTATTGDPEQALRTAIETVVLEWSSYGYRRVTAELQRTGWPVNHKRVLRIMREEGWLWRGRRRWVRTTDSEHGLQIYPNLLTECGWRRLTAPNQAWVADLTYIRLAQEFCYLAVLLDAFSRRVVGWSLSRRLDASFALAALEQALGTRQPPEGWIHHSDRGVQYACRDYVTRVTGAGGRVSMAAKGTPRENAQAESFMRTLKHEEVYLAEYGTFAEAERGIGQFISEVYDRKRLHSALGYRPPQEFEELFAAGVLH
jgi:transposase InsO family protein